MTTQTDSITALALTPSGNLFDVRLPREADGTTLKGLYATIDCDLVDVVGLTSTLDMWVDDEGLSNGAEINWPATGLAGVYGHTSQSYGGTVVLTEHDDEGNTVSLRPELRAAVVQVLTD
ncbi:MAG: DUF3846 domain-containing protein [Pseudonocardia sp.]|nr:DUF3846 domain-containing protein [Pseudonocardia sp.]